VPTPELAAFVPLLLPWAAAVVLAGARAAGFVLGLPHTTGTGIPRGIQAMVVLALAVAMVGARPNGLAVPSSITALAVGVILEFLFGLLLGFLIQLALAAVRVAGELVGIEMGLSFAAVADPLSSGQTTPPSALFMQLGIALFLALGLDRVAIAALVRSIDPHPLGAATIDPGTLAHVIGLADGLVGAALGFALPLIGALLCLKLAMAMLARVAPKLQIFTLAFGLSIGVGLILLELLLPSIAGAIAAYLQRMTGVLVELALAG
jgi:flagellar biosynthetic protein FliR